jgi:hypothetical protein
MLQLRLIAASTPSGPPSFLEWVSNAYLER